MRRTGREIEQFPNDAPVFDLVRGRFAANKGRVRRQTEDKVGGIGKIGIVGDRRRSLKLGADRDGRRQVEFCADRRRLRPSEREGRFFDRNRFLVVAGRAQDGRGDASDAGRRVLLPYFDASDAVGVG